MSAQEILRRNGACLHVNAESRRQHVPAPATFFPGGDAVGVEFDEPQRAITPGQAVVFSSVSW